MASKNVHELNGLNFDEIVTNASCTVLVDFSAAWCKPCQVQLAILEQIGAGSEVVVATVDVDECPDLTARFGIRGMPTLIAFHAGKETARRLGLTNERGIRSLIAAPGTAAPH